MSPLEQFTCLQDWVLFNTKTNMLDDNSCRWIQTLLTFLLLLLLLLLVFIVAEDLGIQQTVVWNRGQILGCVCCTDVNTTALYSWIDEQDWLAGRIITNIHFWSFCVYFMTIQQCLMFKWKSKYFQMSSHHNINTSAAVSPVYYVVVVYIFQKNYRKHKLTITFCLWKSQT